MRLLQALDAQELADDPRFRENKDRMAHLQELEATLTPYFKRKTTAQWLQHFEQIGMPAGPVNNLLEMHQDPQVLAREMVIEVDHSTLGKVKTLGLPVKFSQNPW